MPGSRLPLLVFTAGTALLVAGIGFVYWPAALIVAGVLACLTALDFSPQKADR